MISLAKHTARSLGLDTRALYHALSRWSIEEAMREQQLGELVERLRGIVPDLRDQFTGSFDDAEYRRYWEIKMRAQQAWQVRCALDALAEIGGSGRTLVDIGDSSGTHARYIEALAPAGQVARCIGVNLDPHAVGRIRAKGGEAIECRAEELDHHGIKADLYLSFETVEHLTDPIRFLHTLAEHGSAEYLLMTVPYRRTSRFGGVHMRNAYYTPDSAMTAEEVHMYEFSPEDWTLLVRFAGFRPIFTRTYRQYALRSLSRVTAPLWRALDFEGFFALFGKRELSLASRYTAW